MQDEAPGLTHPTPARSEHAGVVHPAVDWTSFDRYARYAAIVAVIRANLGPGRHRVLDAGDSSAWLVGFDGELDVVTVDPTTDPTRIAGGRPVVGDGARLPVREASVAAVCSSDALEHIQPPDRGAFLAELARASADLVVVAAPFDTPGVAGVEEFVRRFVVVATGAPQPQLEEHAARVLPDLASSAAALEAEGLHVAVLGNGNLHDWLLAMVLKHQLAWRPELDTIDLALDLLYNRVLAGRNDQPPHYRHVLVARRSAPPVLPTSPSPVPLPEDTTALLGALTAATATEALRRDLGPELTEVARTTARLEVQQDTLAEHVMARFSGIEGAMVQALKELEQLRDAVAHLQDAATSLRHPLATVTRKVRRSED